MDRRLWAALAVLLAAVATGTSWASGNGSLSLDIQLGSSLSDGGIATVTPLSGSFNTTRGKAQQQEGVELFRVDLASQRLSEVARINVILLNPKDMDRVLGNPNAYVEVAAWYEDPAGNHTLSDGTPVSRDPRGSARITRAQGDAMLLPETPGVSTFYILASVTVPGGPPPGGQDEAGELSFHVEVRA